MTTTDTTTTPKIVNRHAAAIYQLIELRLNYMTEAVAEVLEHLGAEPARPRVYYRDMTDRYRAIAAEWLDEPVCGPQDEERCFPVLLALAKFVAFVNVDRGLVDQITDNATIVGDAEDSQHVSVALAQLTRWLGRQDEALNFAKFNRDMELRREKGGAV